MYEHSRLSFLVHLRSATAVAVIVVCSGCATTTPASTYRCSATRPAWSYHDTAQIRAKKTADAKRWDSQCTLIGVISSAAGR